jgi:hypothetical protein
MTIKYFAACAVLLALSADVEAKQTLDCKAIDAAISATEDFVEIVLGTDRSAVTDAQKAVADGVGAVATSLTPEALQQAQSGVTRLNKAVANGQISEAALAAMDTYDTLVKAFASRLPTTPEVAMLDHAGFKLQALLAAKPIDWTAISETLVQTTANLKVASQQLDDKAVKDLLATLAKGLTAAQQAKEKDWEHNAAQLLLDSVDLIERTVKNTSKQACS